MYNKEVARKYYQTHKQQRRDATKKWYAENRDYYRRYERTRYHNNKESIQEYKRQHSEKTRDKLFEILGGAICVKCGFSDKRALHFDHINGGGNIQRRTVGSYGRYNKYIYDPELARQELQVLCANCNFIKRYENNEFTSSIVILN